MSTQVAGVLKDPFERPLANTDIDIRAITNTFAVLPGATIKVTTNSQGEYNFILEPANYAVSVILDGRAVYQGVMNITSTTPPGTLPQLLKQAEMLSELPLNYAEYFQQVQATVKDDADRAQAAADGIDDQVDEARQYAEQSQNSAQSSQQSSQTAQQALADTQVIANKFQNLDDAVTETQQNAQQTQSDATQTAADRAAADAAAQRAEDAAGSAETVNVRNLRVPQSETINALPDAATRANSIASFDSSGQSTVTPLSKIPMLDAGGKVPMANIPAAAITEVFPVSSQAQMLALAADPGDVAKRTDQGRSYILMTSPASTLANWVVITDDVLLQLSSPDGFRYIGAVNSFADLRALTPASNGAIVNLRGWRAGSNLGGGLFVGMLSAATDDGGVVASSGGSYHWRRIIGSVVAVEHFGATGDGSTDDSDSIQSALASGSLSVTSIAQTKKYFRITKTINITTDNQTFSLNRCELNMDDQTGLKSHLSITKSAQINNVRIVGVVFTNSYASTVYQVLFSNAGGLIVEDCVGYGGGKAYGFIDINRAVVGYIRRNVTEGLVDSAIRAKGTGPDANRAVDIAIYDNRFIGGAHAARYGDWYEGLFFRRNICYAQTGYSLVIEPSTTASALYSGKIQDNDFDSPQTTNGNIYIQYYKNIQITGNWFVTTSPDPMIRCESTDSVIIQGNQAYPTSLWLTDNGINTAVLGNLVVGGATHVQYGANADKSSVIGNHFTSASSYSINANLHTKRLNVSSNYLEGGSGGIASSGVVATHKYINNVGDGAVGQGKDAQLGASPASYTVGSRPEILGIKGGTVTSVTVNGFQLSTASNVTIGPVPPNSVLTVTYSGATPGLTVVRTL